MSDEKFQRLWEESLTRSLLHVIDSRESLQGAEPGLAFWCARRRLWAARRAFKMRWLDFRIAVFMRDQGRHPLDNQAGLKRALVRWYR